MDPERSEWEVETSERDAKYYLRAGNNAYQQGDRDEALRHYQKSLDLDEKFSAPQVNIALVLDDQGKTGEIDQ